jgi:murein DD-endopeptidase MepM/ murein hydrolase activator NlpD
VSRSSAPAVLPRTAPGKDGAAHPPLPLPSLPVPRVAADDHLDGDADDDLDPPAPLTRRRLPHPPGKRAPLWLAALIAGALLAALPPLFGSGPSTVASAADYGLGVAGDVGADGGMNDPTIRQGITEAEARQRLNELAASRAAREPKTVLPVHGRLTTCFCMRWGAMHYGIDLAAPLGTPILAATDGVVLRAGPASGFGNAVYIQDADGDVQVYGHMRYYYVHAGEIVHAGDLIAKVGDQGESTGPHLHFQLDRGSMFGRPFDPIPWFKAHGITIPGG